MPIEKGEALDMVLDPIRKDVQQYVFLKDEVSTLETRVTQLKKRITTAVEDLGEPNEKGSIILAINEPQSGTVSVVKQRRVSKMFDEETANRVLKEKDLFESCTETITVLNQDAVMAAYYNGQLTDEDIEKMFPEKVSWALILEKK